MKERENPSGLVSQDQLFVVMMVITSCYLKNDALSEEPESVPDLILSTAVFQTHSTGSNFILRLHLTLPNGSLNHKNI